MSYPITAIMSRKGFFFTVWAIFLSLNLYSQTVKKNRQVNFKKNTITTEFISEGVTVADVNKDGKLDILAGAFWFEAPTWKKHEIAEPKHYSPATEFSNSFLDFNLDVDQDGWIDLIRISLPGEEAVWYQNPKNNSDHWRMYTILTNAGNESPAFVDIDGDGRQDLLCNDPVAKEMIWMKSPTVKGDTMWKRFVIDKGNIPGVDRYTHGLGWFDINKDGRNDVVTTKGWWECPTDVQHGDWKFHPADLGEDCSQIYSLDVKGEGGADLVSSSAHNYGIWWHEKIIDEKGAISWQHHVIFKEVSQTHGLGLADINGDGYADLITGKRYFAHNGKDPGAFDPAMLYWFELKPGKKPEWIPHQIDNNSGVGLQVVAQDIDGDGLTDIVVCNKKGLYFFEQTK